MLSGVNYFIHGMPSMNMPLLFIYFLNTLVVPETEHANHKLSFIYSGMDLTEEWKTYVARHSNNIALIMQ